jgi:HlyD family secretion protein
MGDPIREIRIGGALIAILLVSLITSATFVRMDSAMHSSGVVRVDGNRQTVQSALAGTISAIRVRDGGHVEVGDVLVELAAPEVRAQERSYASRVFGLQAEIARIETELAGGSTIVVPQAWTELSRVDLADAQHALTAEQMNLAAQRDLIHSQRRVLSQQEAQAQDQLGGYRQRRAANLQEEVYTKEELQITQGLFNKGYATKQRLLALQRSSAGSAGERGAINAEIARLGNAAAQARLQVLQLDDQHRQEITERLRTARTELQSVLPQWQSARRQVEDAKVRAPARGTVLGLVANTIGGVVPAGGRLMDIVPAEKALVVEASIPADQMDGLSTGQPAIIRVTASGRMTPELTGTISRISADAETEERSGRSFYKVIVGVTPAEIAKLAVQGVDNAIRPGAPVSVTVSLKKRTLFQFMLGPLTQRFSTTMSER